MSDFQVFENPVTTIRNAIPFVVSIQSGMFDTLSSRLVVPLYVRSPEKRIESLAPVVSFDGQDLIFMTYEMTAFRVGELEEPVGSLETERYRLLQAIDLLITGV